MRTIKVTFINPSDKSDIVLELGDDTLLRDVYSHLVSENFLIAGKSYTASRKGVELDNDGTLGRNGVVDNDTVQIIDSTKGG